MEKRANLSATSSERATAVVDRELAWVKARAARLEVLPVTVSNVECLRLWTMAKSRPEGRACLLQLI